MTNTMRSAIIETLRVWESLDEWHKGKDYESARKNLENMLKDS